jgi:IS30 family transposase
MTHVIRSQRDQLEVLHRAGHSQKDIATLLGFHQSTISRELSKNGSAKRKSYNANRAQKCTEERRKHAYDNRLCWHNNPALLSFFLTELSDKKSPDQIAGRLKQQKSKQTVSHQSLYAYIKMDKEAGGNLYKLLRYQGKKYKWRGWKKNKTGIPNRKGIEERPEVVNTKERAGDWESDLVVSHRLGSGAVATFAERKYLYFRGILVKDKSADEMVRASNEALGFLPSCLRQTMTHDNGREIAKHEEITKNLQMPIYCARPYRSCDRGLNEWYNRELRRFFPKGTDFSQKTQADIDSAVDWLNNCPRRSLGYCTPMEMLQKNYAFHP